MEQRTMTVEEALKPIAPVVGVTTLVAGISTGDLSSIGRVEKKTPTLAEAKAKLDATVAAQNNCGSDWAYWGYEGEIAYLRAMVDILTAAEITKKLPYVPPPDTEGRVVMDCCSIIERYGADILKKAKDMAKAKKG